MKTFRDKFNEYYSFDDGSFYLLRSYSFELNFLYQLKFPNLVLIREGTYAYCYDYIATLKDKEAINDNK